MWATRRIGVILPKDAAADWAIARLGDARDGSNVLDATAEADASDEADASGAAADVAATSASLALARDASLGRAVDDWSSRAVEAVVAARLPAERVRGR